MTTQRTPTGHASTGGIQQHSLGADYPFLIIGVDTPETAKTTHHLYRAVHLTSGYTSPTRDTYEAAQADIARMKLADEVRINCSKYTAYRLGYIHYTSGARTGNPFTRNATDYGLFGKGAYDAVRLASLTEATFGTQIQDRTGPTTNEQTKLGEHIAELLRLPVNECGRYNTTVGDKSALGLYLTLRRVINGEILS
jgi:hypothetical protein